MDLTTRLRDLHSEHPSAPSDQTVAADLLRGHRALTRRRVRRGLTAATGVLAVGGIATALALGTSTPPRPQALQTPPPQTRHLPAHRTQTHRHIANPAIRLVDYTGPQKHGFDVAKIPDGWELQDSEPGYLTIGPVGGDRSDGASFVGKLVVMLRSIDAHGPLQGKPVTVNGRPAGLADDGTGVRTLSYHDGGHIVQVQAWSNVHITEPQLITFAEGVTVTADVAVSRG